MVDAFAVWRDVAFNGASRIVPAARYQHIAGHCEEVAEGRTDDEIRGVAHADFLSGFDCDRIGETGKVVIDLAGKTYEAVYPPNGVHA